MSEVSNDASRNAGDLRVPLSDHEKAIIRAFADGDQSRRDEALAIHRAQMCPKGPHRRDPYFRFMSEFDNPKPDLMARARYRLEVLNEVPR